MTTGKQIQYIPLGTYLFQRLAQVNNLRSIFGVPGDFNLPLLEHVYNVEGLKWTGNCNELNAGYAADGYARVNGFGVLVTTFGVGELSAINATNGSFVEDVPVLQIVGTSSTFEKREKTRVLHHLVTPKKTWDHKQDHFAYENIVDSFCIVKESLDVDDLKSVQERIDHVIETIYRESKPGYLFIPVDIPNVEIPVDVNKKLLLSQIDQDVEQTNALVAKIQRKLESKNFAILADSLIKNRSEQLNDFVGENKIHTFSTTLGKSIIDEISHPELYHGTFAGKLSTTGTLEDISNFELILHLGYNYNEVNNFKGSKISNHAQDVIEVGKDFVRIDGTLYTERVNGWIIFDKLLETINREELTSRASSNKYQESIVDATASVNSDLSQTSLLTILQSTLRANDILVTEMCSFLFSIPEIRFPKNCNLISQNFYGSIGYALPATLGASLAIEDANKNNRVLLIEGDGSAQMTIQELASFIRYDIKPTMLLLSNEGYTVERAIMGETRSYNDIAPNWNWTQLFKVFGDIDGKSESSIVKSNGELQKALVDTSKLKMLELRMQKLDVPWRFEYICGKRK